MNIETIIVLFAGICLVFWMIKLWLKRLYNYNNFILDFFASLLPIMILVLVLRSFIAENFLIPSGSMKPSLLEGDFVVVSKYDYGLRLPITGTRLFGKGVPQRGQVVVFRSKELEKNVIKRVVGLPGDKIKYINNILYINDQPISQDFINTEIDMEVNGQNMWMVNKKTENLSDNCCHLIYTRAKNQERVPEYLFKYNNVTVPENSYFVMGDNRDFSKDSRFIGFITDQELIGKANIVWMSWDFNANSILSTIRWDRLFHYVN